MLCAVETPLYIYKLWAMDGEKFATSFGLNHFSSFRLSLFSFVFLSFNSFSFLPLSSFVFSFSLFIFFVFYSFLFKIKKRWKQNIIIKFTRFIFKKNKITFYFNFSPDQVSVFNKIFLFFLILSLLPFPARTPGLNFCFYGAQRLAYAKSRQPYRRDLA